MKERFLRKFQSLDGRAAFVTFTTAGDPDFETSRALFKMLPRCGVDIVEMGMPFSDPTADGPIIEASYVRALANGHVMARTLQLVRDFRKDDAVTPLVLYGYFNVIHAYGVDKFLDECESAGVDGFLTVDLPAEHDADFCLTAEARGFSMIRLIAPTTPRERYARILKHASGFVYNIAIAGVTGTTSATAEHIRASVAAIKEQTDVPVATGFGIKTPEQARDAAAVSDAVVVGSAIIEKIAALEAVPVEQRPAHLGAIEGFIGGLSAAIRGVKRAA